METIFTFLGVSAEEYDFHAAENLPVSGSSDLATKGKEVQWAFTKKEEDFNPVERFQSWSRSKHERFNWLAGESLAYFNYKEKDYDTHRSFWVFWNKLLDTFWLVKKYFIRPLKKLVTR